MTKTVSVDFDGVLHSYASGWTGYTPEDDPEPGARDFILDLIAQGFHVVIVSSRAHTIGGREAIKAWLELHGFPLLEVTDRKVMACAYVDDRAVPYQTGSSHWKPILHRIRELSGLAAQLDSSDNPTLVNHER